MNDELDEGMSTNNRLVIFVVEALDVQMHSLCGGKLLLCVGYRANIMSARHTIASVYQLKLGSSTIERSELGTYETQSYTGDSSIVMKRYKETFENLLKEKVKDPKLPWWEEAKKEIAWRDEAWFAREKKVKQDATANHAPDAAAQPPAQGASAGKASALEGKAPTQPPPAESWFNVVLQQPAPLAQGAASHRAAGGEKEPDHKHDLSHILND